MNYLFRFTVILIFLLILYISSTYINNYHASKPLDARLPDEVSIKSKIHEEAAFNYAWLYFVEYCRKDTRFKFKESSLTEYLNGFKNFPHSADFNFQNKTWNVFITNGLGDYNITVDKELSRGTIDIKKLNDALYTLEDFKSIIGEY